MYADRLQHTLVVGSALAIVLLMSHSIYEYVVHLSVTIPYAHREVGVPVFQEGTFARTQSGIPPSGLPWVLDPSSVWTVEERQEAESGCGLLRLCASRYPHWCGAAVRAQAASCSPGREGPAEAWRPTGQSKTVELAKGPELILERQPTVELVLDRRGLWMRGVVP